MEAFVELAAGARLWWRDEVLLGRWNEPAGSWSSYLHVDRCRGPLLRHHLVLGAGGPGTIGPAVVGQHRAVASLLVVGDSPPSRLLQADDGYASAMPLAGNDATLVSAAASDHPALRRLVAEVTTRVARPRTVEPECRQA